MLIRILDVVSMFLVGLFSGALVLIAFALVPYWRSLPPQEFHAWFSQHVSYLREVMVPLGRAATLLVIAATAIHWREKRTRLWCGFATILLLGIGLLYVIIYPDLNAQLLSTASIPTEDNLKHLLSAWATWHWWRTLFGCVAFLLFLEGIAQSRAIRQ